MQGKRLEDVVFGDLPKGCEKPGTYWKYLSRKSEGQPMQIAEVDWNATPEAIAGNLTGTVWGYHSPDGGGLGILAIHTVREEEDGTISVRAGDGSSNSILHHGSGDRTWHGYIEHGVWNPC